MNRDRIRCDCGTGLNYRLQMYASSHDEKKNLGSWCPACGRYWDPSGKELRPVVPIMSLEEIREAVYSGKRSLENIGKDLDSLS
jgi:hypothetical protein